ncbi:MAG: 2Fe-2S iron-sulfur cluster binding domain-containing protein [Cycloclasticus sp.]|jgi:ferredoxin|nr:2Fe-2S iron-sulfur cluster binding domain-containing protein [Cycloclasticus sp.]MDF1690215.1 2Fe-2S iron-sulfur cluster-binding protein [Cycloclasticus sp.]MEE4291877.1 2Fe-2S iron-sulfur cluster-binding protein [Cycloclasticus sp.]
MESIVVKESFKVTLLDTGESFNCTSQQHVLSAMSKMGKKGIPSGCHGGGCGVCKVKIMEGTYHTKKMSRAHVSIEEENAGCALACRVFPTSALSMNVIGKLQKNILKKTK